MTGTRSDWNPMEPGQWNQEPYRTGRTVFQDNTAVNRY
jgi:hypothetical protein